MEESYTLPCRELAAPAIFVAQSSLQTTSKIQKMASTMVPNNTTRPSTIDQLTLSSDSFPEQWPTSLPTAKSNMLVLATLK